MKHLSLTTILFFIIIQTYSQQTDWINSNQIHYSLNPGMVFQTLDVSANGNVISSRVDSGFVVLGSNVYGRTVIECLDAGGNVQWDYRLTDSVVISHILTDMNDDIYLSGRFIGTAHLNNTDSIVNSSTVDFNEDQFLLKLSSTGTLIWKRNLSLDYLNNTITTLACDQNNNFWFSISDWIDSRILMMDSLGAITDSLLMANCKGVSGISFDNLGSLYICGAAESGTMRIGTEPINIPDTYMMYIARLDAATFGVAWTYVAHDITFQSPQLVSDGTGGVYFAGTTYDSLTWGSISFNQPQWNTDFFLTRVDSSGTFLWGRSLPVTPTITGRLSLPSPGQFLDTDLNGNAILLGKINGSIDWGNGIMYSGVPGTQLVHVVSFDKNNQPFWQKTGGGTGNFPTTISMSSLGEVYFTAAISGTCTFDAITVNVGGSLAATVVKLSHLPNAVDELKNLHVLVYPNPAINSVNLPQDWSDKYISIYGMDGRLIKTVKVSGSLLDLDEIDNGNYILKCEEYYARISVIHD